jgi:tRNA G10  N-methylase Trm11
MRQLDLFQADKVTGSTIKERIVYRPIGNKVATFKSGTNKLFHQWFRLTPSFGPALVDIMLEKLAYQSEGIVLDPFCGASTTLIHQGNRI